MNSLENNTVGQTSNVKLCKTHNVKSSRKKTNLSFSKSYSCAKTYHPLKHKSVKVNKIRFVAPKPKKTKPNSQKTKLLLRKYKIFSIPPPTLNTIWVQKVEIINWLLSVGIFVKRLAEEKYFLMGRECAINHILVFANKKRVDMGLPPFYVEGLTEY
ncbi:MAG: hypothetical protein LBB12_00020 [Holosporaceae bacterium]|jgi:hypothetical protein|nr:hypothetical protein [Holosporaceae bacterium]